MELCWGGWHMPIHLEYGRPRWEDCKSEMSLGFMVRLSQSKQQKWNHSRQPFQKELRPRGYGETIFACGCLTPTESNISPTCLLFMMYAMPCTFPLKKEGENKARIMARMKMFWQDTHDLLCRCITQIQCTPKSWSFPRILCIEMEKSGICCPSERQLVSCKEILYSSDNLSDYLIGETAAPVMMSRTLIGMLSHECLLFFISV